MLSTVFHLRSNRSGLSAGLSTGSLAVAENAGWIAGNDGISGNIFRHDTARSDDGVLADGDVTQNDAAAANRRSMFDQSWLDNPVGFRLKLAAGIGRLRVAVVDEHDLMAHEHAVFDGDSFTDEAVA